MEDYRSTNGFLLPALPCSNETWQTKRNLPVASASSSCGEIRSALKIFTSNSQISSGISPSCARQAQSRYQSQATTVMDTTLGVLRQRGVCYRHEMLVPNALVGCIIGRGGSKINEIRESSRANIKIFSEEEGTSDRRIVITGTPEAVRLAHYLICNSIELHKHIIAMHMAMQSLCSMTKRNNPDFN